MCIYTFILFIFSRGCFLTSSLIATLSVSLTIPLTVLFDVFLKKVWMMFQMLISLNLNLVEISYFQLNFLIWYSLSWYFCLFQVDYPLPFFLGTLPMFLSFFAVAFLTHYENWDPVLVGIRKLVSFCCRKSQK